MKPIYLAHNSYLIALKRAAVPAVQSLSCVQKLIQFPTIAKLQRSLRRNFALTVRRVPRQSDAPMSAAGQHRFSVDVHVLCHHWSAYSRTEMQSLLRSHVVEVLNEHHESKNAAAAAAAVLHHITIEEISVKRATFIHTRAEQFLDAASAAASKTGYHLLVLRVVAAAASSQSQQADVAPQHQTSLNVDSRTSGAAQRAHLSSANSPGQRVQFSESHSSPFLLQKLAAAAAASAVDHDEEDTAALAELRNVAPDLEAFGRVVCDSLLPYLARSPVIHAIEIDDADAVQLYSKGINYILQSGGDSVIEDSSLSPPRTPLPPSARPIWDRGLRGLNQVIGLGDTGVDMRHCFFRDPAFPQFRYNVTNYAHRKVLAYFELVPRAGNDTDIFNGHGTHLGGVIAGSLSSTQATTDEIGDYIGVAPDAKLVVLDMSDGITGSALHSAPGTPEQVYDLASYSGARVMVNAWGGPLTEDYGIRAFELDSYLWVRPNLLDVRPVGGAADPYAAVLATFRGMGLYDLVNWAWYYDEAGRPWPTAECHTKNLLCVGATFNNYADVKEQQQRFAPPAPEFYCDSSTNTGLCSNASQPAQPLTMLQCCVKAAVMPIPYKVLCCPLTMAPNPETAVGNYELTPVQIDSGTPFYANILNVMKDRRPYPDLFVPALTEVSALAGSDLTAACNMSSLTVRGGSSVSAAAAGGAATLIYQWYGTHYNWSSFIPEADTQIVGGDLSFYRRQRTYFTAGIVQGALYVGARIMAWKGLARNRTAMADSTLPAQVWNMGLGYGRMELDRVLKFNDSNFDYYVVANYDIQQTQGDTMRSCWIATGSGTIKAVLFWADPPVEPISTNTISNHVIVNLEAGGLRSFSLFGDGSWEENAQIAQVFSAFDNTYVEISATVLEAVIGQALYALLVGSSEGVRFHSVPCHECSKNTEQPCPIRHGTGKQRCASDLTWGKCNVESCDLALLPINNKCGKQPNLFWVLGAAGAVSLLITTCIACVQGSKYMTQSREWLCDHYPYFPPGSAPPGGKPGLSGGAGGGKSQQPSKFVSWLKETAIHVQIVIGRDYWIVYCIVFLSILYATIMSFQPLVIGYLLQEAQNSNQSLNDIRTEIVILAVVIVAGVICMTLIRLFGVLFAARIEFALQTLLMSRTLQQDRLYFMTAGGLLSVMLSSTIPALASLLSSSILPSIASFVSAFLLIPIVLLIISWRYGLIVLIVETVVLLEISARNALLGRYMQSVLVKRTSAVKSKFYDTWSSILTLTAWNIKRPHAKVIVHMAYRVTAFAIVFRTLMQIGVTTALATPELLAIILFWRLIVEMLNGNLTLGLMISFFVYYSQFFDLLTSLRTLWAATGSFFGQSELLCRTLRLRIPRTAGKLHLAAYKGTMAVSHVHYRYPTSVEEVLTDVNLNISSGEKIVIMGPSGSGKSTLLYLLLAQLQPTSGRVTFDGIDSAELSPQSLARHFSYVPQVVHLLRDTISENIKWLSGMDDVSQAAIEAAAKLSSADDWIGKVHAGYDTIISENTVSGGQRRTIAIAAALLRNTNLFIADEISADLDPVRTEYVLQVLSARESVTTILVSHDFELLSAVSVMYSLEKKTLVPYRRMAY